MMGDEFKRIKNDIRTSSTKAKSLTAEIGTMPARSLDFPSTSSSSQVLILLRLWLVPTSTAAT
jgi:hypothetical protein